MFSSMNISYPFKNVAIAVSGGSDSVFLAQLLLSFENKLIDKSSTRIMHINHNWRGEDSLQDQQFVEALAKQLGVPCDVYQCYPDLSSKESPELLARNQRKEIFAKYETVLTGHNADDLYETILWKTLQGRNPEDGILVVHQNEVRPLLQFTKVEMQNFLTQINQPWKEDSTNHDGKLLRSKMRQKLMPTLDQTFPDAKMTVVEKALDRQIKKQLNAFKTVSKLPFIA